MSKCQTKVIFGTRLLNLRDGSWLWFIGLSIQLLDTHLASEDGNCLVQHHLEGPSGATCACIARVPFAKISFSPQLMLACVFVVNRQLKRVGKALYKLKNTKQVLAIIMHQTLMHSQTPQGISTWCLELYPCASQVREVMNVDSQAKDRNFILCVFCLLCACLRFFFFPNEKKNFFHSVPGKNLAISPHESSFNGTIPHSQKNYVRPQSWLACTQRKHATLNSMECLNWPSDPAPCQPLRLS